jgi:hypothetical protein
MVSITKNQQQSLLRKWRQSDQGMSYRAFRRTVEPIVCDQAVAIKWCGMWLCIEPDGYTHS